MAVVNKNFHDRPLMPLANPQFELLKSEGFYLHIKDKKGVEKKILNWSTGIACEPFGGCHPDIVNPVIAQKKLISHSSLTYDTKIHLDAGRMLVDKFDTKGGVIFCMDGMKANETMLKAFYAYHEKLGKIRSKIIVFEGAFHGRSVMEMAATGKYEGLSAIKQEMEKFFIRLPFNNLEALQKAADDSVAGILIEPIQGEGGIAVAKPEFMKGLSEIASKHGILVASDEIQVGMLRSGGGKLFAYQHYGIKVDMLSLAKALGGGVEPVGATLFNEKVRSVLTEKEQYLYNDGATFSGMPPAMAAVIATLKIMEDKNFLKQSMESEKYLRQKVDELHKKYPTIIEEVRGQGFILGLKLAKEFDPEDVSNFLKDNGISTQKAGGNVLRILPPLNTTKELIDEGAGILDKAFSNLKKS